MTPSEDLSLGLDPDHRFRCLTCGNLTRFDVVAREHTRRFHHFDLGGQRHVEEEEVLERIVESVSCRWCGNADVAVEHVATPAPQASAADASAADAPSV